MLMVAQVMTEGKHVLLMLYWTNCDHCHNLMPGFENIAEVCAEANENAKPPGEPEIIVGRIEGTRNDIGHPRIYAGSYPQVYFIPAGDKDHPIQVRAQHRFVARYLVLISLLWCDRFVVRAPLELTNSCGAGAKHEG